jgi:hypothetical protein
MNKAVETRPPSPMPVAGSPGISAHVARWIRRIVRRDQQPRALVPPIAD